MRTRPVGLAVIPLIVVAGVAAGGAAPPAAADRMLATAPLRHGVEFLSAHDGVVVWGGAGRGPFGRYAYFASSGGPAERVPIASPTGGDVDLGPGADGGTVLVYERCRDRTSGDLPTRCDIYRYGLGNRRASPVPGASSRRYDEHSPSVWGGRVAFLRGRVDANDAFIFAGPHLGLFLTSPLRRLGNPGTSFARPTDLQKRTLAYSTEKHGATSIRVKRFDSRGRSWTCQIARSETEALGEPQLDGGYVYWSRATSDDWTIHRRLLPTRLGCRPRGPEQVASNTFEESPRGVFATAAPGSFAVDRGRLFYGVGVFPTPYLAPDSEVSSSEIWELEPVTFENR